MEDEVVFENPLPQDSRSFSFRLPIAPYSFSGAHISLVWGIELDIKGGKEVCSRDYTLSPFEKEIVL